MITPYLNRLLYHIRQYFGFSRHETYGVLGFLILIACALSLPYLLYLYDSYQTPQNSNTTHFDQQRKNDTYKKKRTLAGFNIKNNACRITTTFQCTCHSAALYHYQTNIHLPFLSTPLMFEASSMVDFYPVHVSLLIKAFTSPLWYLHQPSNNY